MIIFVRRRDAEKWQYISCGKNHTLAINNLNNVYSTGYNKHGELGLAHSTSTDYFTLIDSVNNIMAVSAGCISLFLNNSYQLFVSGKGKLNGCPEGKDKFSPEIIPKLENQNISSFSSGYTHSAYINSTGEMVMNSN